ncbi:NAD(P)-dependent dehydrogenase, short-chain alcohol dehydrogenase family [Nocardia farcinica]|uniref:Enoyl-[acyl-carrier-protein] reductase [NADPH] FabL n=1 Tax=Nocardia farcinica TaxID=37329 RepID=A0A0H5NE12_NOCFR|nr:SDR family NAD(P)-dependent oxidoreductase [Nocardia farcinica]AXK89032.1 SDR family NAD(P)-dependent oxidoreductase [Nocardia farcinica]MBF6068655.1 SDR family NAD(P)-dependent oxidoreductase [Nocardia farcinica]MBF6360025.1 SDR family NAD(P)-dependent oxidoreductase [Nocardia farcinica]MBF6374069.1 SDR family NAD(P)-dependent oxidoreductase [Nocardia farcinica]MBF6572264.1 SDR family NAD(P)-dependent oxidoreductase [Nocardia farcinica]
MSGIPDLRDRVAVVTGASRGIGKGIALELGAAGATVYLTGRSTTPGKLPGTVHETAARIDDLGGTGVPVVCDHRDDDAVARLFDRVRAEHARLDVLVNNVYNSPAAARWLGKPFWQVPPHAWDETFDVGVRSHYAAAVFAAPLLIESGGLLVNISSPGARRYMHNAVYGVAKAALDRLTADLAHDLADTAVTVVSLWPGIVNTELLQLVPADAAGRRLVTLPGEGTFDLDAAESPHFAGRAVVALAADPDRRGHTGAALRVADLAERYGFTDLDGRVPRND